VPKKFHANGDDLPAAPRRRLPSSPPPPPITVVPGGNAAQSAPAGRERRVDRRQAVVFVRGERSALVKEGAVRQIAQAGGVCQRGRGQSE